MCASPLRKRDSNEPAYSDHLPIRSQIKIKGHPLNIISCNILGQTGSGVHPDRWMEESEDTLLERYSRILDVLLQQKEMTDLIMFQEIALPERIKQLLKEKLEALNWDCIIDEEQALVTCYNKKRLTVEKQITNKDPNNNKILSVAFRDKKNNVLIDTHNVNLTYNIYPEYQESTIYSQLTQPITDKKAYIAILAGDTNSRVLTDKPKSSKIPPAFNQDEESGLNYGCDKSEQVFDHPDGVFFSRNMQVEQAEHDVLDFKGNTLSSEALSQEERSPNEQRADKIFRPCITFNPKMQFGTPPRTLSDYREQQDKMTHPLWIGLSMNADGEHAVCLSFNDRKLPSFIKEELHPFRNVALDPVRGQQRARIIIPTNNPEALNMLYSILNREAAKSQALREIEHAIERLKHPNWADRLHLGNQVVTQAKIASFEALKEKIEHADTDEIETVITQWEHDSVSTMSQESPQKEIKEHLLKQNNAELMKIHRSSFFKQGETNSWKTLQNIKRCLGETKSDTDVPSTPQPKQ